MTEKSAVLTGSIQKRNLLYNVVAMKTTYHNITDAIREKCTDLM